MKVTFEIKLFTKLIKMLSVFQFVHTDVTKTCMDLETDPT